ncbi:MAG TPA: AMP-binding protein [Burkholderiales bacterium]|nr:AMP-binding protein [Burkholderiales bacterium]
MVSEVPYAESCAPGLAWPGVPAAAGAAMLAMQWQLERSQWFPSERLAELQFRQVRALLAHAITQVPFYRAHLGRAGVASVSEITPATFSRWPILTTPELQSNSGALQAATCPDDHGPVVERFTSGSTGTPKRILDTHAASFYKDALVLRDHLWHRRDLSAKFAGIHFFAGQGRHAGWSPAINAALRTGPGVVNGVGTDVAEQWAWLREEEPGYLLTTPSNLAALVRHGARKGERLAGLRQVLTYTEPLPVSLRAQVKEHWGVGLADTYSCTEAGALALQCPQGDAYHVQSENVYLEVLRADGSPCMPRETGRVVVTLLHNFAMPLIRYELGDYATVGEPCACGRSLPVLHAIAGRARNMARDPQGRVFQPGFDAALDESRLPVSQFQFVQETPSLVEMSYVCERELSAEEKRRFSDIVKARLPYPFELRYRRVPRIERGPGGKYEGFISKVA